MSSNKGSCGHRIKGQVITGRMIRDVLGFNGPRSIKGLEEALKADYAEFAGALAKAIARGEVREFLLEDNVLGTEPILMFSTDWIDDVKGVS